jgi:hypothetical protein
MRLGRAVAQVVSRRLLTAEARIRAHVSPFAIVALGQVFIPSSSVFPC